MTEKLEEVYKEMVGEFQCPGCVCGSSPEDGCYKLVKGGSDYFFCGKHVPGTTLMGAGSLYLGLPRGFNKVGMRNESLHRSYGTKVEEGEAHNIRLWIKPPESFWDRLNVAVWAMEYKGYLLIRTYSPRVNCSSIDVVKNGTLALVPDALDVGKFADEID